MIISGQPSVMVKLCLSYYLLGAFLFFFFSPLLVLAFVPTPSAVLNHMENI